MRKELLTFRDPKSPVSEIFRTLRTNIQFMNTNKKLKTLLVTSTFPEEGKSWISANLAVTFAQAGKKVVLIDADMRKGRQYTIFGVLPKPGLSNYLSNMDANNNESEISITKCIQETEIENLHIITAGNVPPNPSELLVSRKMRDLLNQLKDMCDLIIIDGTPCDLVTDAFILSRIVDSTVIVTAQKETKKDNLTRIVKNIQNVGGKIAGVVLNKVDMSTKKYNQSYYYGSMAMTTVDNKRKSKKQLKNIDDLFAGFQKRERDVDISGFEEEPQYNEPQYEEPQYRESQYNEFKYEDTQYDDYKINKPQYDEYENNESKYNKYQYNEIQKDETQKLETLYDDNYYETKKKEIDNKYKAFEEPKTYKAAEIDAKIEPEGTISKIKIDQNMDEKTKDILRQVNEYIESEKRRQGENY